MQFSVVWLTITPVMNVAVFVTTVAVRTELLLIIKFTIECKCSSTEQCAPPQGTRWVCGFIIYVCCEVQLL